MTEEINELFRKLKPIYGAKIDKLWAAYLIEDYKGKREIENILSILSLQSINNKVDNKIINLEPPSRSVCSGEYLLGKVIYNNKEYYEFGLQEKEWIQHVGIFGRSGSGKTNTVFVILKALIEHNKPFLIFDWKRNYRDLLADSMGAGILAFTVGRNTAPIRFNPLIPVPGVDPRTWLKKLIEIISHAYFLGEGVMYLLQKAIDSVYHELGVYDGKTERYPTMSNVLEYLEEYPAKGREAQWMASTLRAVGTLCFGEMGKILNTTKSSDIGTLLEKQVIFELDALTNSDKTFFIETVLLWIHHFRLSDGRREEYLHAIFIEEAHHILLRQKQELTGGEAITDVILREIRELGEGIILIDQHPSLISLPALGNTYCTIAMNLKHRSDVNTIADAMLIESKDKHYLGELEVGEAVIKLQGRWFQPFLIRIPEMKIRKGFVTDEVVKIRMQGYSAFNDEFSEQIIEETGAGISPIKIQPQRSHNKNSDIGTPEISFLKDVALFPFSGVVQRYKRLKISRRKGNAIKEKFLIDGSILPVDIVVNSGRIVLLKLTEKAVNVLKENGINFEIPRYDTIEHEFWKDKLGEYYRSKGYTVEFEKEVEKDNRVDIVITKDSMETAIEIETGKSDIAGNLLKNIRDKFESVIIVATNTGAENKIKRELFKRNLLDDSKIKVINTKGFY